MKQQNYNKEIMHILANNFTFVRYILTRISVTLHLLQGLTSVTVGIG